MNPFVKSFLTIGKSLLETMVPAIANIEALAKSLKDLKGAAKADAVVEIGINGVLAAEGVSGKDFVNDAEFQSGVREVNEGLVKVLHAVQRKTGA